MSHADNDHCIQFSYEQVETALQDVMKNKGRELWRLFGNVYKQEHDVRSIWAKRDITDFIAIMTVLHPEYSCNGLL